ncbi:hypothetical protein M427DRAFT_40722 [Gonapodya prolifera JEL478]|uniref:HYDIN/VesB/CFA65-like Ig-like domain-containing protein n=1 Tax=Gonapodya prolifera (strain JEL478) TaxID=1344416 RepID=A0A139AZ36_GONPJ|nr:hypothetical protein M427DRAFT_40722 [Gonapodya prolifera JEL478]|eukprot:KXS21977.1 hypothetical protein M427DRAFT_40722 [Gonapodya prolifera JEL478]
MFEFVLWTPLTEDPDAGSSPPDSIPPLTVPASHISPDIDPSLPPLPSPHDLPTQPTLAPPSESVRFSTRTWETVVDQVLRANKFQGSHWLASVSAAQGKVDTKLPPEWANMSPKNMRRWTLLKHNILKGFLRQLVNQDPSSQQSFRKTVETLWALVVRHSKSHLAPAAEQHLGMRQSGPFQVGFPTIHRQSGRRALWEADPEGLRLDDVPKGGIGRALLRIGEGIASAAADDNLPATFSDESDPSILFPSAPVSLTERAWRLLRIGLGQQEPAARHIAMCAVRTASVGIISGGVGGSVRESIVSVLFRLLLLDTHPSNRLLAAHLVGHISSFLLPTPLHPLGLTGLRDLSSVLISMQDHERDHSHEGAARFSTNRTLKTVLLRAIGECVRSSAGRFSEVDDAVLYVTYREFERGDVQIKEAKQGARRASVAVGKSPTGSAEDVKKVDTGGAEQVVKALLEVLVIDLPPTEALLPVVYPLFKPFVAPLMRSRHPVLQTLAVQFVSTWAPGSGLEGVMAGVEVVVQGGRAARKGRDAWGGWKEEEKALIKKYKKAESTATMRSILLRRMLCPPGTSTELQAVPSFPGFFATTDSALVNTPRVVLRLPVQAQSKIWITRSVPGIPGVPSNATSVPPVYVDQNYVAAQRVPMSLYEYKECAGYIPTIPFGFSHSPGPFVYVEEPSDSSPLSRVGSKPALAKDATIRRSRGSVALNSRASLTALSKARSRSMAGTIGPGAEADRVLIPADKRGVPPGTSRVPPKDFAGDPKKVPVGFLSTSFFQGFDPNKWERGAARHSAIYGVQTGRRAVGRHAEVEIRERNNVVVKEETVKDVPEGFTTDKNPVLWPSRNPLLKVPLRTTDFPSNAPVVFDILQPGRTRLQRVLARVVSVDRDVAAVKVRQSRGEEDDSDSGDLDIGSVFAMYIVSRGASDWAVVNLEVVDNDYDDDSSTRSSKLSSNSGSTTLSTSISVLPSLSVVSTTTPAHPASGMMDLLNTPQSSLGQGTPLPAGVTINGDPYFSPPVNLPAVPAGYTPDGQPFYGKTATIKAIPAGMTTAGIRFYSTELQWSKDSTRNQLAGYDNNGQPFFLPRGYLLPQPSGYTMDGIPYYDAASLLQQKGKMLLPSMTRNNTSLDRFEKLRNEEEENGLPAELTSIGDTGAVARYTQFVSTHNFEGEDNGRHHLPLTIEEFISSLTTIIPSVRSSQGVKKTRRPKGSAVMSVVAEEAEEDLMDPETLLSAFSNEADEWMKEPQDVVGFLRDSHDLLPKHIPIRVYLETGTLEYQSVRNPVVKTAVLRTSRFQLQGEGVIEIPVTFSPKTLKADRVEGTLILMDEFGNKHGTCQLLGTRQSFVVVSPPFVNAGWVLPDRRKQCHVNVENISNASISISVTIFPEGDTSVGIVTPGNGRASSAKQRAFHTTASDVRLQPNELRQVLVTFEPNHLGRFKEELKIEAPGGDVTRVTLEGIAGIPLGIYPEDDTSSLAGAAALTLERCNMMKNLSRGENLSEKPHVALDDVGRAILRNIISSTADYVSRMEAHTLDFGICPIGVPRMRCVTFLNLSDNSMGVGLYSHHPGVRCSNHVKIAPHMAVTVEVELLTDEKHGVRGTVDTCIEAVCPDFQAMQIYVKAFVGSPLVFPYWENVFFRPCRIDELETLDLVMVNVSQYPLSFTFEDLGLPNLGEDVRQSSFKASLVNQPSSPFQIQGCSMMIVTFTFTALRRGVAGCCVNIKILPPHNRSFAAGLGNKPLRMFGICIEPYMRDTNEGLRPVEDGSNTAPSIVLKDKNGIEFIRSWMSQARRVTEELPTTRSELEEYFDISSFSSGNKSEFSPQVVFQKKVITFLPPQSKGGALAQLDEYLRKSQRIHTVLANTSNSSSSMITFFGSPNIAVEPSTKTLTPKSEAVMEMVYHQPSDISDTLTTIGFATGISERDHTFTSIQVIAKHRPELLVFPIPNKLNEVSLDFGKVESRANLGTSDGPSLYIVLCNTSHIRYTWELKFPKTKKYNPFETQLTSSEVRPFETSVISFKFRSDVTGSYESVAELLFTDSFDKDAAPIKLVSIVLAGTSASTNVLGFPDFIQFGSMVVLRSKSRKFILNNNGTAEADVNIQLKPPFHVHPSNFRLPPNSKQEVTVVFSPTESGFSQTDCHAFVNHKLYTFPITGIGGTAELVCEKYQNKDVEIGAQKEGTVAFITCYFTNVGTLPIELRAVVASVPDLLRVEFSGISATVPYESGKLSAGLKETTYVRKDHWGVLRRKLKIFAILKDILRSSRYQSGRTPGKSKKRPVFTNNPGTPGTALVIGKADLVDALESRIEAVPILKPYNSYVLRVGYAPQHTLSRRDTELTLFYAPITTEDDSKVSLKLIKSTQLRIVGSVYRTLEFFPPFHDFGVAPAEQYNALSQTGARSQGSQYYGVTQIASTSKDKRTFTVDVLNLSREIQNLSLAFISPEFSVSGRTWLVGAGDRISIPVEFHPPLEQMQYHGEARFVHKHGQTVITLSGTGASADVLVDDSVDFGKVRLHTETIRNLKVTNRGLLATRFKLLLDNGRGMQMEIGLGDEPNEYDGTIESGTSLLVPIKAICFILEPVPPSLFIRWQRVPRGVWIEKRVTLKIATGQPMMALYPPELDFKTTYIGLNKSLHVNVLNEGNAACSWTVVLDTPVLEAEPRAGYLLPGDQAWVEVSFNPVDFTPLNQSLTFETDAGTRYLTCSGIVGVPYLKIDGSDEIDFGIVGLNKTHSRNITIRNTGNRKIEYDVSIVDGTIDGQPIQPEDFEVFFVEPMHDVIAAGGTTALKFTAMPRVYNSTMSATYVVVTADGEYLEGQLCVTGGKAIIHVESLAPTAQDAVELSSEDSQISQLPQIAQSPINGSSEQLKFAFQAQLETLNAIIEQLGSAERVNAEEVAKQEAESAEGAPETPLSGRPLPPISRLGTSHVSTTRNSTGRDRLATPQLRRLGSLRNRSPITSHNSPEDTRPVSSVTDEKPVTPGGRSLDLTAQFANEITALKQVLKQLGESKPSSAADTSNLSPETFVVQADAVDAEGVVSGEQTVVKLKLESLADKVIQQTKVIFGASKDFLGSRYTKNKDGLATALRRLQETTVLLEQTVKPQAGIPGGQSEAFNLGTVKGGETTAKRLLFNLPNTGNLSFGFQMVSITDLRVRPNGWDADGQVDLFQVTPYQGSISPGESREFSATFTGTVAGLYAQGYELQSDGEVILRFYLNAKVGNPLLVINPSTIDFGLIKKNQSALRTVLLSNVGTYPDSFVVVGPIPIVGVSEPPPIFSVEPKSGTVEVRQNIPLEVIFAPLSEGPYSRKIKLQWSKEPLVLEIKGVGGAVRLKMSYKSPEDTILRGLDFGVCVVGYRYDRTFELSNIGNVEGLIAIRHRNPSLQFEVASPDASPLPVKLSPEKTVTIRAKLEPDCKGLLQDPIELCVVDDDVLLMPMNAQCGVCEVVWKDDLVLRNMPVTDVQRASTTLSNNGDFDVPVHATIETTNGADIFRITLDGSSERMILRPGQGAELEISVRPKEARTIEGSAVLTMIYGRSHEVRKEIPFKFRIYSQPVTLNESEHANVGRVAAGEVENVTRSITNYSNDKVQYRVRLESIARTPPADKEGPQRTTGTAATGSRVTRKPQKGAKPSTPTGRKGAKKEKPSDVTEESATPAIVMPWVITTPQDGFIDPGDTASIAVAFKAHLDATEDWQEARAVIEQLNGTTGAWTEISTVKLVGASGHPKLVLQPEKLEFSPIGTGKRKSINFVVRNEGTAHMKYQIADDWSLADVFIIDKSSRPLAGDLDPGQEMIYVLTFAPVIAGSFVSHLTISTTLETKDIFLSGEGALFKLLNVPESIDFGDVFLGEDTMLAKFEVQNDCPYKLHVQAGVFVDNDCAVRHQGICIKPSDQTFQKPTETTVTTRAEYSITSRATIPLQDNGLPDSEKISEILKERQWFAKLEIEDGNAYLIPITGRYVVRPLIVTSKVNMSSVGSVEKLIATDGVDKYDFGQLAFTLLEPEMVVGPKSVASLSFVLTPPLIDDSSEVPPFINVNGQLELSTSLPMIPRRDILLSASFVDLAEDISLTPLDFETILSSEVKTLEIVFKNPVRRPLHYSFHVQKDYEDIFRFLGSGTGELAQRESASLLLEFKPQAPNLYQATGHLETDHNNTSIDLRGRAIEPCLDFGINVLDFGVVGLDQPEFRLVTLRNVCHRAFRFRVRLDGERFKLKEFIFDVTEDGTVNLEVEFSPTDQGAQYIGELTLEQVDIQDQPVGHGPFGRLQVVGTGGTFKMVLRPEEDEITEAIEVAGGEEKPKPIPLTFPEVRITERIKKHFEVHNMGDTVLDMGILNHLGQEVKDGEAFESVNVTYKVSPTHVVIPPGSKARFTIAVKGVSTGRDEFLLVVKTRTTILPKEIPVCVDATVSDRALTPSADRPDTMSSATSPPSTTQGKMLQDELYMQGDAKSFEALKTFALADPVILEKLDTSRLSDPTRYRSDEGVEHILSCVLRLRPGLPSNEYGSGTIRWAEPIIRDSDVGGLLTRPAPVPTDVPAPKRWYTHRAALIVEEEAKKMNANKVALEQHSVVNQTSESRKHRSSNAKKLWSRLGSVDGGEGKTFQLKIPFRWYPMRREPNRKAPRGIAMLVENPRCWVRWGYVCNEMRNLNHFSATRPADSDDDDFQTTSPPLAQHKSSKAELSTKSASPTLAQHTSSKVVPSTTSNRPKSPLGKPNFLVEAVVDLVSSSEDELTRPEKRHSTIRNELRKEETTVKKGKAGRNDKEKGRARELTPELALEGGSLTNSKGAIKRKKSRLVDDSSSEAEENSSGHLTDKTPESRLTAVNPELEVDDDFAPTPRKSSPPGKLGPASAPQSEPESRARPTLSPPPQKRPKGRSPPDKASRDVESSVPKMAVRDAALERRPPHIDKAILEREKENLPKQSSPPINKPKYQRTPKPSASSLPPSLEHDIRTTSASAPAPTPAFSSSHHTTPAKSYRLGLSRRVNKGGPLHAYLHSTAP